MVLKPRQYEVPSLSQLRREWTAYTEQGTAHLAREQVAAMLVDQLVIGTQSRSPVETIRDDAENRAEWMKRATWLVLFGVVALGSLTVAILVEGGI
jgi:hypothetical protein